MIFRSNSSLTDGNEVTDCPIRWCPPGLRVRVEVSWPSQTSYLTSMRERHRFGTVAAWSVVREFLIFL